MHVLALGPCHGCILLMFYVIYILLHFTTSAINGGAENAGVEKAGVENAGVDSRGGKCRSGKCRSDNVWKAVKKKSIRLVSDSL